MPKLLEGALAALKRGNVEEATEHIQGVVAILSPEAPVIEVAEEGKSPDSDA